MFAIAPLLPGFHEVVSVVAVGTVPAVLVVPNPRRPILYLCNSTSDDLWLWGTRAAIDVDCPLLIVVARTVLRFTWSMDGPMSTFGWSAAFRTTPGDVALTEIMWHPDQLVQTVVGA